MFLTAASGLRVDSDFWYGPTPTISASGARVTPESAMRLTVVYRCVNLIASTVAKLPLKMRDRETSNPVTDHPVGKLIGRRPNRWQTPYQFRAMSVAHLLLRGNAYSRIVTDRAGQVSELVPYHPDHVTIETTADDWRYIVRQPGKPEVVLTRGEMLHLLGLSADGIAGITPIAAQKDAIGAAISAQDHAARVFKNGAKLGGQWVEIPGKFQDAEKRRQYVEEWNSRYGGANSGLTPIMENGAKLHPLGMTNADAQWIETRKYDDVALCRIFGVPPHKIGVLDRATYSNMEQQNVEFFEEIHSIAANLEQLLQMQLLTEEEEDRYYVQFELKGVLRADSATRGKFYHDAIQDGWMTRNEVREREDMEPLTGLDEPLEPLNMARTSDRNREQALLQSAAERAVTREIRAVRAIVERGNGPAAVAAAREFYTGKHAAYLADALACDPQAARDWCEQRLQTLMSRPPADVLAEWESDGAQALQELMQ